MEDVCIRVQQYYNQGSVVCGDAKLLQSSARQNAFSSFGTNRRPSSVLCRYEGNNAATLGFGLLFPRALTIIASVL
jgi:hypothetical protein